ncbi:PHD and RING finger domain-containing protein C126.07c-like [Aristolochia californica]|uniref:PHD and RING finger domain-containing protein C126.07c-like n=1 Tax=Aristolochia californica TaxID=171875 RepID=UPI0035D54917
MDPIKDNLTMETPFGSSLDFPPNKRLGTFLTSPLTTRKGKEKITEIIHEEEQSIEEEGEEENGASVNWKTCGICLAEDGLAIRGWIDSCSHYFCSVCIMEWAKVESRCPMCKKRFRTIRRPPKSGVFEQERIVHVPVRDQVYDPRGNTTAGPPDPYAQISCFECHSSADESLLLLCDLCDSAAHTYCVGLGHNVPEGDWYCHDCSILRNEHSGSQVNADLCNEEFSDTSGVGLCEANVSIYKIVQKETGSNGLQANKFSSYPRLEPKRTLSSQESQGRSSSVGNTPEQPHARTLHHCRNLHIHIKKLRENWNALRNESVTFSSTVLGSSCVNGCRKGSNKVVTSSGSSRSRSSSSEKCMQTISEKKNSSESLNNKDTADVDLAWKKLKMAQVAQGICGGTSTHNHTSNKKNSTKKSISRNSTSHLFKTKSFEDSICSNIASLGSHRNCSLDLAHTKHKHLKCEKQKLDAKLSSVKLISKQSQAGISLGKGQKSRHLSRDEVSDCFKGSAALPLVSTAAALSPGKSNVSSSQRKPIATSKSQIGPTKEPGFVDENFKEVLRKNDDVKSEIQSLVKLNLKLLTKDRQIGVEKFKEVARSATHTILAACGLEHSKSNVCRFPSVVCRHVGQTHQIHLSNLMPGSCRECFYSFVKDVVRSLMDEKL